MYVILLYMYVYIYVYYIYIVQLTRRTYLCSRTLIVTPQNFLAWTNCGTFRGVWIFKYGQFHGCFRAILNFSAPTFLHSLVAGTSEIQTLASYAVPLSYWKNLTCKALRGSYKWLRQATADNSTFWTTRDCMAHATWLSLRQNNTTQIEVLSEWPRNRYRNR